MADIEKGDTFMDYLATSIQGVKPKYFLCMNDADDLDDKIVCFVMNTERILKKYTIGCNSKVGKFILAAKTLKYLIKDTSLMLSKPRTYSLEEILDRKNVVQKDKIADNMLLRSIKNCIDFDDLLPPKHYLLRKHLRLKSNSHFQHLSLDISF